jgi:hypothetical protein
MGCCVLLIAAIMSLLEPPLTLAGAFLIPGSTAALMHAYYDREGMRMTHQNPAWIVPALTIFTILVFSVAIFLPMTRMKGVRIFGRYASANCKNGRYPTVGPAILRSNIVKIGPKQLRVRPRRVKR